MQETFGIGLILGIESSCDETAAAVVRAGRETLSNVVATQMALHARYGGVVPELAAREHLLNIVPVVREAIQQAGVGFDELDAIAVTEGPGLAGALLVGITYAKALAAGRGLPLIAVNHLEGHIHAVLMESSIQRSGSILALVVSGGHTNLYLAQRDAGQWTYRNVGKTVDDAAGEAFDKVAKLLGLGYPGGPWIDRLAGHGDSKAVPFGVTQIKAKQGNARSTGDAERFDFSFSGLKTAVLRYVELNGMRPAIAARQEALAGMTSPTAEEVLALCDAETLGLIASFQRSVVSYLVRQAMAAAEAFGVGSILVSGGVAANRELRQRFAEAAAERGLPVAFPARAMATDNAAMIAAAAWPKLAAGEFAAQDMGANPQMRLG